MEGMVDGPRREMHAVSGRLSWRPRVVNEAWVSPRPWRRRRMLSGAPLEGGTMSSVSLEGKSDFCGSLGGIMKLS